MKTPILFITIILFPLFVCLMEEYASAETTLNIEDCQKCHSLEFQQIMSSGKAHKEMVTCLDCHESHRPKVQKNIPECESCHSRTPHLEMADCSACHQRNENCQACHDVHQPLAFTDKETAISHCKICHPDASELLQGSTSKHHNLSCAYCHPEHGRIQECQGCHGMPHKEGTHRMFPQCSICHNIAHDLDLPNP